MDPVLYGDALAHPDDENADECFARGNIARATQLHEGCAPREATSVSQVSLSLSLECFTVLEARSAESFRFLQAFLFIEERFGERTKESL